LSALGNPHASPSIGTIDAAKVGALQIGKFVLTAAWMLSQTYSMFAMHDLECLLSMHASERRTPRVVLRRKVCSSDSYNMSL
jgi:hypothetical protein